MFTIIPRILLIKGILVAVIMLSLISVNAMARDNHAPVIDSIHVGTERVDDPVINLVESTTTTAHITGSIRDPDGCGDLPQNSVSAVFYRSTVAGGAKCSANNANCYRIPAENCHIIGCGNSRVSQAQFACDVPVQCYADETVIGRYANTDWTTAVTVIDSGHSETTQKKLVEMGAVVGINVTDAVDYGTVILGGISDVQTLAVQNMGNVGLDVLLQAPKSMRCDSGEIPLGSTHVGLMLNTAYAQALAIGADVLKIDLNLLPQQNKTESKRSMYLRLKVPDYGVGGKCTNTIISTAQIDDGW